MNNCQSIQVTRYFDYMRLRARNRMPGVIINFDQNMACIFNVNLLNALSNAMKVWL